MELDEVDFANMLLGFLDMFHEFQLANAENGKPPYAYNTLGLAEWMEFNYFAKPKVVTPIEPVGDTPDV